MRRALVRGGTMRSLGVSIAFSSPLSLVAAVLAAAAPAQQVWWVDPVAGNNGNAGSYLAPLQTIGAAVAAAGAGDQIHLLAGTYGPNANGETLPISLGMVPQAGIVVRGIGTVVLDLAG